jgi:hypothetical protein
MRRLMRFAVVIGIGSLTLLAVPAFAGTLYGLSTSYPGTVYTINPTTGAATAVVDLTGVTRASFVGLEFLNGTLYATDVSVSGWKFGTINLATGAYTVINDQGGSSNWHGLAADPAANLLYSVDLDAADYPLVSITPGGAIATKGLTYQNIRGLAYDSNHGVLYGVAWDETAGATALYTVDTGSGAAALVGSLGLDNFRLGLAYDPLADILYLNTGAGNGGYSLYRVDTTTGAPTLIGGNGSVAGNGIDGLAYLGTAIPEPGTFGLLLAGGALLALGLRRRAA